MKRLSCLMSLLCSLMLFSGQLTAQSNVKTAATQSNATTEKWGRFFGSYTLDLGVDLPEYTDEALKKQKVFYTDTANVAPVLSASYYHFDTLLPRTTVGLNFKMSYFIDKGRPILSKDKNSPNYMKPDNSTKLRRTSLPLSLSLSVKGSPLPQKFILLSAWGGIEYLYYREARDISSSAASDKKYVNTDWERYYVYGAGVSFLLNWLEGSTRGFLNNMGFSNIYITPYIEYSKAWQSTIPFDRKKIGIVFSFESI